MAETFTDFVLRRDAEGVYDLAIDDGARDLATTSGFDTAIMCSLFSERRAYSDEVADPWKRRGWIGNLLADTPADNYGSGLWLYEQRRATEDVRAALRMEVVQSLDWMAEDGLVSHVDATAAYDPVKRRITIAISATDKQGGTSRHAFEIWRRTGAGIVGTNT